MYKDTIFTDVSPLHNHCLLEIILLYNIPVLLMTNTHIQCSYRDTIVLTICDSHVTMILYGRVRLTQSRPHDHRRD